MTPQGAKGRAPDLHRQGILAQFVADGCHNVRQLGQRNSLTLERCQRPVVCDARSVGTLLAVVAHKSLEAIEPISGDGRQFLLAKHAYAAGVCDGESPFGIGFRVRKRSGTGP